MSKRLLSKSINLEISHRLPNHNGKCFNFHGHSYKVEAFVEGDVINKVGEPDEGMVIDFSSLKKVMNDVLDDKFDHSMLISEDDVYAPIFAGIQSGYVMDKDGNWEKVYPDLKDDEKAMNIIFLPFITTAENLSKYWFELLDEGLKDVGIKLHSIEVYETEKSLVRYVPE